jgi:hypothetical protein
LLTATEDYRSIAFLDFFADLEDPRIDRHKLYSIDEILLTTLCAYICDAKSWEDNRLLSKFIALTPNCKSLRLN